LVTDKTWVYQGRIVNINVTAKNLGESNETFNVTIYYDGNTLVVFEIHDLPPDMEITLTYAWDTTIVSAHYNYTLSAEASIVLYEYDITNNFYVNGIVEVRKFADVDGDGDVDMIDMWLVQQAFGSMPWMQRWNEYADLDENLKIDMRDIYLVQKNFGK
jgi:hypothetical protein